jgi:hypothetical protein
LFWFSAIIPSKIITQEKMIGRRSPRRFNVLTKPTIVKVLTSGSRKPKYVGFRQNPVSAVHEAPTSHCCLNDCTIADVREQANDTKMQEHHLQGDECYPITENSETVISSRIIASKDTTVGDISHCGLKEGAGGELGEHTAVAQNSAPFLFRRGAFHQP